MLINVKLVILCAGHPATCRVLDAFPNWLRRLGLYALALTCLLACMQVHGGPNGLIDASYIWLPLRFGTHSITLEWQYAWDPLHPFADPPASVCLPPSNGSTIQFGNCSENADFTQWVIPDGKVCGTD